MTNTERVPAALERSPGLSDAELGAVTGVAPHQQVNQICRRLAVQGLIRRGRGPQGRIVNTLSPRGSSSAPPVTPTQA
jgi:hypothetical protein